MRRPFAHSVRGYAARTISICLPSMSPEAKAGRHD